MEVVPVGELPGRAPGRLAVPARVVADHPVVGGEIGELRIPHRPSGDTGVYEQDRGVRGVAGDVVTRVSPGYLEARPSRHQA